MNREKLEELRAAWELAPVESYVTGRGLAYAITAILEDDCQPIVTQPTAEIDTPVAEGTEIDLLRQILWRVKALAPVETKPDGWIEWRGGECPVPNDVRVDVEFRSESLVADYPAGKWQWSHSDSNGDIIRYRVIETAHPAPTVDDSITPDKVVPSAAPDLRPERVKEALAWSDRRLWDWDGKSEIVHNVEYLAATVRELARDVDLYCPDLCDSYPIALDVVRADALKEG